jgi:methylmalonyl-CoA mutase N-terminal domain/subunit
VIAHETGVTNTADPLGGSYFLEALTDKLETAAYDYFHKIDQLGGMVQAIEQSYPQREIADASFRYQVEVDQRKRIVVGVNDFTEGSDEEIATLRIDPALERKQIGRLQAVRSRRSSEEVEGALERLREAAAGEGNLMEPLLDCARAQCSEGDIVESLQRVFGSYTETPVF